MTSVSGFFRSADTIGAAEGAEGQEINGKRGQTRNYLPNSEASQHRPRAFGQCNLFVCKDEMGMMQMMELELECFQTDLKQALTLGSESRLAELSIQGEESQTAGGSNNKKDGRLSNKQKGENKLRPSIAHRDSVSQSIQHIHLSTADNQIYSQAIME